MSDIIAQLNVLARDSGCALDISAILDLSVCPKIDIKTPGPHKVHDKNDVVTIVPTQPHHPHGGNYGKPVVPAHPEQPGYSKRECTKPDGCYKVSEAVCHKPTVILDLEILVMLGLLTSDELEQYMHKTGQLKDGEKLPTKKHNVKMDPLLSAQVGEDGSILDLNLGGEGGLLDLNLLKSSKAKRGYSSGTDSGNGNGNGGNNGNNKSSGNGGLLNLQVGGKPKSGKPALIDINALTNSGKKGGDRPLVDAQVGGKNKGGKKATIDVKALTHEKRGDRPLADVQVGGKRKGKQADIDVDVLTHEKRGGRPLVDVQVGGKNKGGKKATIDVKALTHDKRGRPLVDVQVGGKNKGGKKATIDVKALTHDKRGRPLVDVQVGGKRKSGKKATIDVKALTHSKRLDGGLADVQVGGEVDKCKKPALINIAALTENARTGKGTKPDSTNSLLDLNLLGQSKKDGGKLLDLSLLNGLLGSQGRPLLDVQALGPATERNGLINIHLLTDLAGGKVSPADGSGNGSNGDSETGDNDECENTDGDDNDDDEDDNEDGDDSDNEDGDDSDNEDGDDSDNEDGDDNDDEDGDDNDDDEDDNEDGDDNDDEDGDDNDDEDGDDNDNEDGDDNDDEDGDDNDNGNGNNPSYGGKDDDKLTHYQPVCGKGFKDSYRKGADKCKANDPNHCLAICQSKAALATIKADVGEPIHVCIAVEFGKGSDNCHYVTGPETKPCEESDLEESKECTSFVKN